jgi:uroporphyrinogen decarboxylase
MGTAPRNDLFLRACRGEPVERTPIWIMRQAGRYLPEYRAVRERHSFWQMCTVPELCTEVTLQPVDRIGVDAAILFSDILVPLVAMGIEIDFTPAPVMARTLRTEADVESLRPADASPVLAQVAGGVRMLRRELDGRVPLIGFAGAPFTLATYAACGGGSRNQSEIRSMLFGNPALAHRLLERLTDAIIASLRSQIAAGIQAVQLFDSWAGILSAEDYDTFALPYARQVLSQVREIDPSIPRIYFAPGASALLDRIGTVGAEVTGIDWRIPLARAREVLGDRTAIQGNLDPGVLLGTPSVIEEKTIRILAQARGARGHVMNLGHGILPETPVENAVALVEAVRRHSARDV